jgi:tetratricopeptide (TPR) repeat protein
MNSIQRYEEMLRIDPGSRVFELLAEELCSRGLWAEAVRVCRQGLTYHPDRIRGRVLLGWALKESGELNEAEKVLIAAEMDIRKNAMVFKLLARIAESADELDRAESLMNTWRNLQPGTLLRTAPPRSQTKPPSRVKTEKPSASGVLNALVGRLESKSAKDADPQKIFTEEDRKTLSEILMSAKH